jgi:hypothetical protein
MKKSVKFVSTVAVLFALAAPIAAAPSVRPGESTFAKIVRQIRSIIGLEEPSVPKP